MEKAWAKVNGGYANIISGLPCEALEFLTGLGSLIYDLKNLDTSKVTDISGMFKECTNLNSIELNLNTKNVINMSSMFKECSSLGSLDLSNLDTSSVKNM